VLDFATLKVCPSAMQLDIPRMFASRISGGAVVAAIRLYAAFHRRWRYAGEHG
jgi:hypothetical protein